jgi:hypothetical protein
MRSTPIRPLGLLLFHYISRRASSGFVRITSYELAVFMHRVDARRAAASWPRWSAATISSAR